MDTIADSPDEAHSDAVMDDRKPRRVRGKPFSREVDWKTVTMIAASAAAGAVLGAGVALLLAPHSGEHTRLALARSVRKNKPWRRDPWERLGAHLRDAAARKNRRLRSDI